MVYELMQRLSSGSLVMALVSTVVQSNGLGKGAAIPRRAATVTLSMLLAVTAVAMWTPSVLAEQTPLRYIVSSTMGNFLMATGINMHVRTRYLTLSLNNKSMCSRLSAWPSRFIDTVTIVKWIGFSCFQANRLQYFVLMFYKTQCLASWSLFQHFNDRKDHLCVLVCDFFLWICGCVFCMCVFCLCTCVWCIIQQGFENYALYVIASHYPQIVLETSNSRMRQREMY